MRIVTLKDEDFNQEFVPSTDIKDINAINAKWDFLFRDPFHSNTDYNNWRLAHYIFKPTSNNYTWENYNNSYCSTYILNEDNISGYAEPFDPECIFANYNGSYGANIDTFGKAYNPYYIKDLDEKLSNSRINIPNYTKKIYVKGFDEFEVISTSYRRNYNDDTYSVVESKDYYRNNGNNYNSNLGASFKDIDKTQIRDSVVEGGYTIKLPYLKDSQINAMFTEIKKKPWEPVVFKLNAGTITIKIKPFAQEITYVWKPTKNIAVKIPRYHNDNPANGVYDYQYMCYDKDVEYIVTPKVTSDLLSNKNVFKFESISFGNTLKDPCANVNMSNYEYGFMYIPNTEKLLHLPALDVAVDIRDQITEETRLRQEGDTALLQKINKEAQDRATAVSNEATARTNADNSLDQKITTEKNDRIKDVEDEENARKKAIEEEAKIRKEEDDKLEDKKLNRYDKDEKVDGVKPDWDEEPTRNSHKAVNSDAVYKMCKNLRLYQANIGKDKIAVAKLKPVDYPFQVTIFSKGEMATFDIHSTVMGRALTPGCNLSAKYYMTSDWIYLYFKPAQGPVSLTISANDSEGMVLTETDKFPELATTVPLAK